MHEGGHGGKERIARHGGRHGGRHVGPGELGRVAEKGLPWWCHNIACFHFITPITGSLNIQFDNSS